MLERRLAPDARSWLAATAAESAGEASRFAMALSLCSRHVPRGMLAPTDAERAQAFAIRAGWNPERWSMHDAARAVLVLARADRDSAGLPAALEECFRYADVGEMVALYRTLALLPDSARFVARSGEGCRSSMRVVYEAAACDTPLPFESFDDKSWRQLVIKALFVEAPLWRVFGLDQRIDAELARMALDLCDERRSASRPVQHELWLCLGRASGDRGRAAIESELSGTNVIGRRAAAIALARAGASDRLAELLRVERDPAVRATMSSALAGRSEQSAFQDLEPTTPG